MRGERGQAAAASVLLVLVMVLIAGAMVDVYRLQEARSWAYRAAEAAALTGVTLGRDLSTVYTHGRPRVDPGVGHDTAEQALLDALARWGATRYAYDIRVAEWGGEVFSGYPPVARADMWGESPWQPDEPAVGVYLEMDVQTYILGLVNGNAPVAVHVFAAAGVATP